MTVFAGGQRVAQNPAYWQAGIPTVALLDGDTSSLIVGTDITVGYGCFRNTITNTLQPTSTNGIFAGIVFRANNTSMGYTDSRAGFSNVIPASRTAEFITHSSVPVYVAVANETGGLPLPGSLVYVMPDGTFQTQIKGGTAPTNGILTNFLVKNNTSIYGTTWTAGALVEITNKQKVLG